MMLALIWPAKQIILGGDTIQYADYALIPFSANYNPLTVLQETYHGAERMLTPTSRLLDFLQALSIFFLGKSFASVFWLIAPICFCLILSAYITSLITRDYIISFGFAFFLTINPASLEYLAIWPTAFWWFVPANLFLLVQFHNPHLTSRTLLLSCLFVGLQAAPYFFLLCFFIFFILLLYNWSGLSIRTRFLALIFSAFLSLNWSSTILISIIIGSNKAALPTTESSFPAFAARVNQQNGLLGLQYPMFALDALSNTLLLKYTWVFTIVGLSLLGLLSQPAKEAERSRAVLIIIGIISLFAGVGPTGVVSGELWLWIFTHVPGATMLRSFPRAFNIFPGVIASLSILHLQYIYRYNRYTVVAVRTGLVLYGLIFYLAYINTFNWSVRYYAANTGYERLNNLFETGDNNSSLLFLPNTSYENLSNVRSNIAEVSILNINTGYYAPVTMTKAVLLQSASSPDMGIIDTDVRAVLDSRNLINYSRADFTHVLNKLAVRYVILRKESKSPEADLAKFPMMAQSMKIYLLESNKFSLVYDDNALSVLEYCCWTERATSFEGRIKKLFTSFYLVYPTHSDNTMSRIDLRFRSNQNWIAFYLKDIVSSESALTERCHQVTSHIALCVLNQLLPETGSALMSWIVPEPDRALSAVYVWYWPDLYLWCSLLTWAVGSGVLVRMFIRKNY